MATSSAAITPTRPSNVHRSFTLPPKLSDSSNSPTAPKSSDPGAYESLFAHQKCKIVLFSPPISLPRSRSTSLSSTVHLEEPIGVLPWASQTERTMAAGALKVYRVPGSVAFLNSGKIVHPILPKSQCWCVDGKAKFMLRVRDNNYFRIEFPCENDADQKVVDDFKLVLANILQYETTACPFRREFYVELPEKSPQTPKKPWTPKHTPVSLGSQFSPELGEERDQRRRSTSASLLTVGTERGRSSSSERSWRGAKISSREYISERSKIEREDSENAPDKVERLVAAFEVLRDTQNNDQHDSTSESRAHFDESLQSMPDTIQTSQTTLPISRDSAALDPREHLLAPSKSDASASSSVGFESQPSSHTIDSLAKTTNALQIPTTPHLEEPKPEKFANTSVRVSEWLDDPNDLQTPTNPKLAGDVESVMHLDLTCISSAYPSSSVNNANMTDSVKSEIKSINSSIESHASFHSFHSPTSPLPPSPPYTEASPSPPLSCVFSSESPRVRSHKRDKSELTVTAENFKESFDTSIPSWLDDSPIGPPPANFSSTESNVEDDDSSFRTASVATTPERKARTVSQPLSTMGVPNRRRTHSPLPSPANIYMPPTTLTGHLTSAILQKTCNVLLGPPIQLVALMMNLASRFAVGTLESQPFTYGNSGQPIPCSWGDDEDSIEGNSDNDQDDYGISLGGTPDIWRRNRHSDTSEDSGWDID